jgi:hypothetical protein
VTDADVPGFDAAFVTHLRRRLLTDPDAARALRVRASDPRTQVEVAVQLVSLLTLAPGEAGFAELVDSVLDRLDGPSVLVKDPVLDVTIPARIALLHAART